MFHFVLYVPLALVERSFLYESLGESLGSRESLGESLGFRESLGESLGSREAGLNLPPGPYVLLYRGLRPARQFCLCFACHGMFWLF